MAVSKFSSIKDFCFVFLKKENILFTATTKRKTGDERCKTDCRGKCANTKLLQKYGTNIQCCFIVNTGVL